jgi:hypothetical protein
VYVCGYSGSNPASALQSLHFSSSSSSCYAAIIYLLPTFVILLIVLARPFLSPTCELLQCITYPSSIHLLLMLLGCFSYVSFIYLFPLCVILLSALSRLFLSPTCKSLYYVSFIYLFPMFVIPLRVPFYLPLMSHCVARPLSVYLAWLSVLW